MSPAVNVASADVALSSTTYGVSDTQPLATVTVLRTGSLEGEEHVYYGTHKMESTPGIDYENVGGLLTLAAGQSSATFTIPVIVHDDWSGPPEHVAVFLYSSWPEHLSQPSNATLLIDHDAPLDARNPANPLGLPGVTPGGNPLAGATFYADRSGSPAGRAELVAEAAGDTSLADALSVIANQSWPERFGSWNGVSPASDVFAYLRKADATDSAAVPMISTYRIVNDQCQRGGVADTPAEVAAYHNWIDGLSYGIGNFRAVLFLEMDSLITAPCLHPDGLAVRFAELRYAISALERNPHLVVYIDAGAADALPWQTAASWLLRAGVRQAQGFFLNSTHFDWTTTEIAYGQKIAQRLGGVHFVVSTGANGRGPLIPPDPAVDGNEVLCNPPGRGLGPKPTSNTGYRWVDAFAWIGNVGESDGACVPGAPPTGVYWPAQAASLVANADFNVTGPGKQFLLCANISDLLQARR